MNRQNSREGKRMLEIPGHRISHQILRLNGCICGTLVRSPPMAANFLISTKTCVWPCRAELHFESMVTSNASVLDLIQSEHTFLNERLAKHYEIPGVHGSRYRREFTATPSPRRHSATRQHSTLTSYATRTSPVVRGNWVLKNILGRQFRHLPMMCRALTSNQRLVIRPACATVYSNIVLMAPFRLP